ncbi:hypothetical protein ACT8ZV_07665 [Nocardioides sp. MAHUQ-72]|uniref:hypothetical protein n=1 Tax=unclassified Nocardioides TaxID=2615069 RepID=UPI0036118438
MEAPEPDRPAPPPLVARGICVRQGRRTLLPATDLTVAPGQVVEVVGPPGPAHAALALALAGRLALDAGTVTLGGDPSAARLQAAVALVDVPGVNDLDDLVPWHVVLSEELAMAGQRSSRSAVAAWLGQRGEDHLLDVITEDVPGADRGEALLSTAALRPGTAFLVWVRPERHGLSADQALALAQRFADRGLGVVVTGSRAAAAGETARIGTTEAAPSDADDETGEQDPQ